MRFLAKCLQTVAVGLALGAVMVSPQPAMADDAARAGGLETPAHGYWYDPPPRWVPARPHGYHPHHYRPPPVYYAPAWRHPHYHYRPAPPPVYYAPPRYTHPRHYGYGYGYGVYSKH